MKFLFDKYYDITKGEYPFFKYCPKCYRDYYINLIATECLGYNYNYLEPETFNEKIRWLIYNEKLELKTKLSDKILVKSYIASKLGKNKTSEIYGIYNNFDEIDFSILPSKFALKANHGWKMNMLVNDKNTISSNRKSIKETTNKWLKTDFEKYNLEPQYKNIKKKLFIERLRVDNICNRKKSDVYCFNSEPLFIVKWFTRSGTTIPIFFNTNWNAQSFTKYNIKDIGYIPDKYKSDKMLEYAKVLSEGFSFVRIDFTFDDEDIQVEEMTFTPFACKVPFLNRNIDLQLGKLIKLPNRNERFNEK